VYGEDNEDRTQAAIPAIPAISLHDTGIFIEFYDTKWLQFERWECTDRTA